LSVRGAKDLGIDLNELRIKTDLDIDEFMEDDHNMELALIRLQRY